MLDEGSAQVGICSWGFCGEINQSIGQVGSNPPTAIEFGVGTPGISGGASASVQENEKYLLLRFGDLDDFYRWVHAGCPAENFAHEE